MRILPPVGPTAEQLAVLSHNKPGILLLRGAAGSGKTTTALMRLKQQCREWLARRTRLGLTEPVRVLVLTYNKTLRGYISELAENEVPDDVQLELTISTFGKWARNVVIEAHGHLTILGPERQTNLLKPLLRPTGLDLDFGVSEIDWLLGRYPADTLATYLTDERTGRGVAPRVDRVLRQVLLDDVVAPYEAQKNKLNVFDWNDIAIAAGNVATTSTYDVIIVDEAQDFSANQMRTVLAHASKPFSMTLVMDAAQRIYPRSFTWKEVGVTLSGNMQLTVNHRNTRQIASFARSLLDGVPVGDDGTLPDLNAATTDGPKPVMLEGKYSDQFSWVLNYIRENVELKNESLAFMQVKGGGWFDYLRGVLTAEGIEYCELTRQSEWPTGPQQAALITFHSAKGLEFDHVVMLGLNQQVTPHGHEDGDATLDELRRLIAMGIGRARKSVVVGYKDSDASTVISLFEPGTYDLIEV